MPTQLDKLLSSLAPSTTLEETERRTSDALNRFRDTTAMITDWDTFRAHLCRFLHHLESTVLHQRQPIGANDDFLWGRCVHFLMNAYGSNGEKAAFERTRTGTEGGLNAVLKEIAHQLTKEYNHNELAAKVDQYWRALDADQKHEAVTEYVEKYAHLIPPELAENNAARLRMEFREVLKQHPYLIQAYHRATRDPAP